MSVENNAKVGVADDTDKVISEKQYSSQESNGACQIVKVDNELSDSKCDKDVNIVHLTSKILNDVVEIVSKDTFKGENSESDKTVSNLLNSDINLNNQSQNVVTSDVELSCIKRTESVKMNSIADQSSEKCKVNQFEHCNVIHQVIDEIDELLDKSVSYFMNKEKITDGEVGVMSFVTSSSPDSDLKHTKLDLDVKTQRTSSSSKQLKHLEEPVECSVTNQSSSTDSHEKANFFIDTGIKYSGLTVDKDSYREEVYLSVSEDEDSDGSELSISSTSTSSDSSSKSDDEKKKKKSENKVTSVKNKGELDLEDLPPIEELNISVPEKDIQVVGRITGIVGRLVVIESFKNSRPLNFDSILFLENGVSLGRVDDVFGPVKQPMYVVRFNTEEEIKQKEIHMFDEKEIFVYYAPSHLEFTNFVFVEDLMKQKGSDASWTDNNEPPEEYLDYSDDEKEKQARSKRKAKNRKPPRENELNDDDDDDDNEIIVLSSSSKLSTYSPRKSFPPCQRGAQRPLHQSRRQISYAGSAQHPHTSFPNFMQNSQNLQTNIFRFQGTSNFSSPPPPPIQPSQLCMSALNPFSSSPIRPPNFIYEQRPLHIPRNNVPIVSPPPFNASTSCSTLQFSRVPSPFAATEAAVNNNLHHMKNQFSSNGNSSFNISNFQNTNPFITSNSPVPQVAMQSRPFPFCDIRSTSPFVSSNSSVTCPPFVRSPLQRENNPFVPANPLFSHSSEQASHMRFNFPSSHSNSFIPSLSSSRSPFARPSFR